MVLQVAAKNVKKIEKYEEVILIDYLQEVTPEDSVADITEEFLNDVFTHVQSYSYNDENGVDFVKSAYNVDGDGINIAFLEAGGGVDESNVELTSGVIYNEPTYTNHATDVAIVGAGRINGVASGSDIFVRETTIVYDDIDWLIDNGANVINCSWGINADSGEYTALAMYIDYVIRNTRVSIVKSAGNRGSGTYTDALITVPGAASNLIVVGSWSEFSNDISNFSSYKMDDSDYIKPNIIAPGGEEHVHSCGFLDTCYDYYSLDIVNSDSEYYEKLGTSFAAPQVSGAIALMMEYEPSLMTSPHRIMAMLTAGADVDSLSSQTMQSSSGLSKQSGSGLMDLAETFEIMAYTRWDTYTYTGSSPDIITIDDIYLQSGRKIRISHVYLRNQIEYDTTNDNFNDALSTDTYTIKIRFRSDNGSADAYLGAIAINGNVFISAC